MEIDNGFKKTSIVLEGIGPLLRNKHIVAFELLSHISDNAKLDDIKQRTQWLNYWQIFTEQWII